MLFPKVESNAKPNLPKIVFLGGFPDDETSGWGHVLPEALWKEYHLIFLCFPGFEADGDARPWAYDFPELVEGMHETIQSVLSTPSEKFILIAHDWGALVSFLYLEKYAAQVTKFVCLDVGLLNLKNLPWKQYAIISVYQLWLSASYLVYLYLGKLLSAIFIVLIILPGLNMCIPTYNERPRCAPQELHGGKCYPYYYFWKRIFNGQPLNFKFPKVPTLYMVRIPISYIIFSNVYIILC